MFDANEALGGLKDHWCAMLGLLLVSVGLVWGLYALGILNPKTPPVPVAVHADMTLH